MPLAALSSRGDRPVAPTTHTYRYAPFGAVLAGGISNNNRRFTGETQDLTGLLYLRARYYDPTTGRFLTRDPVPGVATLPQTLNPYAYALNNPVLYVDPSGEFIETPWDLAVIAFDLGMVAWDAYYYTQLNPCASSLEKAGVWTLDMLALAVDALMLLTPGGPGFAGPALALARGGTLTAQGVRVGVIIRGALKAGQIGKTAGQVLRFAAKKRGGSLSSDRTKGSSERHHLLPRQFKKEFERAGLDIEDFVVPLPKEFHKRIHGKGGGAAWRNSWNMQWAQFFDKNPNPSKADILWQLERVKKEFGIP